jgi:hypothetical protein
MVAQTAAAWNPVGEWYNPPFDEPCKEAKRDQEGQQGLLLQDLVKELPCILAIQLLKLLLHHLPSFLSVA